MGIVDLIGVKVPSPLEVDYVIYHADCKDGFGKSLVMKN